MRLPSPPPKPPPAADIRRQIHPSSDERGHTLGRRAVGAASGREGRTPASPRISGVLLLQLREAPAEGRGAWRAGAQHPDATIVVLTFLPRRARRRAGRSGRGRWLGMRHAGPSEERAKNHCRRSGQRGATDCRHLGLRHRCWCWCNCCCCNGCCCRRWPACSPGGRGRGARPAYSLAGGGRRTVMRVRMPLDREGRPR